MGLGVSDSDSITQLIDNSFSLIINRQEAWRTDGGTAIFGGGALALSLVSIALNLYQVGIIPPKVHLHHLIHRTDRQSSACVDPTASLGRCTLAKLLGMVVVRWVGDARTTPATK